MKKLIVTSTLLIAVTAGASMVLAQPHQSGADEKPPIVLQVENHEERIGDLEEKTDKTQTQVNQNSADIGNLQSNTKTSSADKVEDVRTPVNKPYSPNNPSNPSNPGSPPTPTPTPEPVINPLLIVNDEWTEFQPANIGRCVLTFENGQVGWYASTMTSSSSHKCQYVKGRVLSESWKKNNLRFDTPKSY